MTEIERQLKGQRNLSVTKREHNTILAALRYWQATGMCASAVRKRYDLSMGDRFIGVDAIATDGDPPVAALTEDEIDHLCQR